MKKEEYKNLLIYKLNLSEEYANTICQRLLICENKAYSDAIKEYAFSGKFTNLTKDKYSVSILINDYGMDYLNAVMMLVWIENDPKLAIEALDSGLDYII